MEVIAGYKQTDVGVIPEDWEVKRIGEITSIDSDNLSSTTDPLYEFNYVSLEDVYHGKLLNVSELEFKNAPSRARRIMKENDILFSTVRPNLKSHYHFIERKENLICSTGFSIIRSNNYNVSRIIFENLFFSIISKQIEKLITGSNYPAISSKDVKNLQIPLPPTLAEQEKIATALSDTDALITSLETLVSKKRSIKQGTIQELLTGKRRLPGFGKGKDYKQTDVGMIPEDWEVVSLGELIYNVEYGSSSKSNQSGQIPVLRMGNIQNGQISWENLVYTDNEFEIQKYFLKKGDVLFNRTNTIDLVGKTAIYKGEHPAIFAGYLIRINVQKLLLNSEYLNYFLNTRHAKRHSKLVLSVAVGQANINGEKLKQYPIPLPPTLAEQTAIAEVLSDMDAEIDALETKLEKVKLLKQGMMQKLLTGAIRLV